MKPIEFWSNLRIINQLSISHSCSSKFPSFIFTPKHGFILESPYSPYPRFPHFWTFPGPPGPRSPDFHAPCRIASASPRCASQQHGGTWRWCNGSATPGPRWIKRIWKARESHGPWQPCLRWNVWKFGGWIMLKISTDYDPQKMVVSSNMFMSLFYIIWHRFWEVLE